MHLAVGITFELVPRSFMEEHPAVFPNPLTDPDNVNHTFRWTNFTELFQDMDDYLHIHPFYPYVVQKQTAFVFKGTDIN